MSSRSRENSIARVWFATLLYLFSALATSDLSADDSPWSESCRTFIKDYLGKSERFFSEMRKIDSRKISKTNLRSYVRYDVCFSRNELREFMEHTLPKLSTYNFRNPVANMGQVHERECARLRGIPKDYSGIFIGEVGSNKANQREENMGQHECVVVQNNHDSGGGIFLFVNPMDRPETIVKCIFNTLSRWMGVKVVDYNPNSIEESWIRLNFVAQVIYKIGVIGEVGEMHHDLRRVEKNLIDLEFCR